MSSFFSVILTHRHGAGIFICNEEFTQTEVELKNINIPEKLQFKIDSLSPPFRKLYFQTYLLIKKKNIKSKDSMEFLSQKNMILARSLGRTAESLLALYERALENLCIEESQIKKILLGTGPGSFTGLRLGAAFVQGLVLTGSKRTYEIPTLLTEELINNSPSHPNIKEEIESELSLKKVHDPSSGQITFYDMLYSIIELENALKQETNGIDIKYGKECTPVLRLTK